MRHPGRITVETAARTTGIPRRTLYRWVTEGRLTVVRAGGTILIDPLEVDELVAVLRDHR